MKTVAQIMTTSVLTARPNETVSAAVERFRAEDIDALPVIDGDHVIGIVTLRDLLGQPSYRPIREVMSKRVVTVSPGEPITAAYALLDAHRVSRLPVVDQGRLVGMIPRAALLHELGKLTDPLTDLPWAGALRQQAEEHLQHGQEVTILFVDLDGFGEVNKQHGHVTGDRVIKEVAAILLARTDPKTDFLCRYAGDEFAILTTRPAAHAEALADALRKAVAGMTVQGIPPGVVSASIGIAGGTRSTMRRDIHAGATVDDLLTLASRASTVAKRGERRILHGHHAAETDGQSREQRLIIRRINLEVQQGRGQAAVELEHKDHVWRGEASGPVLGTAGLRLLAEATTSAVRSLLPSGWDVAVEQITRTPLENCDAISVLLVVGTPAHEELLLGSAIATANTQEAVVRATMKALNRRLSKVLQDGRPA